MLELHDFGSLLKEKGFTFFSGVPCSFLNEFINYSINNFQYITSTNEGEAVAISAGAYLGGKKPCVLMQNSGLTNALNPLASLNYCFQIPVLGFVSWRGEPGLQDEPEHLLLGEITGPLLDQCKIPNAVLSSDLAEAEQQLETALENFNDNKPFFFIVKKNTFSRVILQKEIEITRYRKELVEGKSRKAQPTRLQVLEKISQFKDKNTLLLTSTGKCGRELFEYDDSPNNLYMIGSMGYVSSIALGICLARPDKHVIALDGDGALLMRMGSMVTNGFYRPKNLLHVLLDNQSHDSTGGQDTVSGNVDFSRIAYETGYEKSMSVNDVEEIGNYIKQWKKNPVLTFMHVRIKKGSKNNLGRPTIKPHRVKERFMSFINNEH